MGGGTYQRVPREHTYRRLLPDVLGRTAVGHTALDNPCPETSVRANFFHSKGRIQRKKCGVANISSRFFHGCIAPRLHSHSSRLSSKPPSLFLPIAEKINLTTNPARLSRKRAININTKRKLVRTGGVGYFVFCAVCARPPE